MRERILFLFDSRDDAKHHFRKAHESIQEPEFIASISQMTLETPLWIAYYRSAHRPEYLRGVEFDKVVVDELVPPSEELRTLVQDIEGRGRWSRVI